MDSHILRAIAHGNGPSETHLAGKGLEEIVVSVAERNIDLSVMGLGADTMLEEETAIGAHLGTIGGRGKSRQQLVGVGAEFLPKRSPL